ncbi:hypothetical protein N7512_005708 [Penicillium capsulatum]|nr:hypothetical protein N7512_005708 [Penicillium capsulatum]
MSSFSTLTGKFRIHKDGPSDAKNAKRPRDSLVCKQCRKGKLRCDRRHPCSSCVRRDEAILCSYEKHHQENGAKDAAEDRLDHLESLVKDLMQAPGLGQSQIPAPPKESPFEEEPKTQAQRPVDSASESRYVGSTHWSAILDDILELKVALGHRTGFLAHEPTALSDAETISQEDIIFGSANDYSLQQIIAEDLPPKTEVDRLLAVYFQGETFIIPFIHTLQFQRHYRIFWADPTQVNPLWLSMLFSICAAASLIRGTVGITPSAEANAETSDFHAAAGRCLVLGEYHRPQQYVLEALTMYAQCKNLRSLDPSREAGLLFGIIVRMAHEMGYHRDPDSLGSLTVFEGEMRRRFWAILKQVDLMVSFQLGLPSNICLENSDTKPPRNLTDADFDEDTQVLPPARDENEPIGLLWFIVKDRQMASFSKVCRDALSFDEKSEAEILQLDEEIRQMHTTIPGILRTRPLYVTRGRTFSTQACIEAGQRLVGQFIAMYKEFSPGGQLHRERWMLTNFTINDFLLGVMVLCLAVHTRRRNGEHSAIHPQTEDMILPLLREARAICVEKSPVSRDARYVSRAVSTILDGHLVSAPAVTGPAAGPIDEIDLDPDGLPLGWLDAFLQSESWKLNPA